ncbi:hypothetical protein DPMN_005119 [Dreissena polymorpha]|uniref:DDE Tnp4 domain-containing protein n=1 Tax=Dreissena polymorpha TaxID=45954 RepID=A0A9D4MRJ9_DREPO|nr:hypothetical protein DPMN_005119 [Dreissena polymorpha]
MGQYIRFLKSRHELKIIADGFHQRCEMLGVERIVDGTHRACPAPTSEHRSLFISSLVLQAVGDSHLKLLDICPGWPSSVHDAHVYRNGPVAH